MTVFALIVMAGAVFVAVYAWVKWAR